MNLLDIVHRGTPKPWVEGDNIPWNDPEFSKRMLKEHLSQEHDAASRRFGIIDQHIKFIHEQILNKRSASVLDLGCGPGLYSLRLARLGCSVRGIDYSPASIEYASGNAAAEGLSIRFDLADVREADYGEREHDLVMFIYGEINVFSPKAVREILSKAFKALKPGGILLLEPSTEESIFRLGKEQPSWSAQVKGLFSDRPHLTLFEAYWNEEQRAAVHRHIVVDAETAEVTRSSASYQCYHDTEMRDLLEGTGFGKVHFYPSLTGMDDNSDFYAVTAQKPK